MTDELVSELSCLKLQWNEIGGLEVMRLIMMVSSRDGLRTNRDKVDLYHRGISPYSIVLRFS